MEWYLKHFNELPRITVPASSSATGSNDGEIVINAKGSTFLLAILEVKLDWGDALFQALCYVQKWLNVSVITPLGS